IRKNSIVRKRTGLDVWLFSYGDHTSHLHWEFNSMTVQAKVEVTTPTAPTNQLSGFGTSCFSVLVVRQNTTTKHKFESGSTKTSFTKAFSSAGLGTEVYMTPQPNSRKTGSQQFDEMYNYMTKSGIKIVTVWIQVTSPINWSTSIAVNVNFIDSITARQYGLSVGIYTNYYDWSQITSGLIADGTMLWYWNVYGPGVAGESPPDFTDFHSFAGWTAPVVKQFAQVESVCGVTVNRYARTAFYFTSNISNTKTKLI
ncbi:unnamed protein product, partial [Angiostrongylus costaricensis]|uniref:GH26 domain-containing protein n=1 Tax=Angiostrongylus costaricensis TaxID=334426 RepID=A0A0R3PQ44_ANGCS